MSIKFCIVVNSDNPRFEGKSKAQRKKMALAAYYAKQNEEADLEEAKDTVVRDKDGKVKSWSHEGDWHKTTKKDPRGKVTHMSDVARRESEKMAKESAEECRVCGQSPCNCTHMFEEAPSVSYRSFMTKLSEKVTMDPAIATPALGSDLGEEGKKSRKKK